MKTETYAQIHHFAGHVALHTDNSPTVYLSPRMARQLSRQLLKAAKAYDTGTGYPRTRIFDEHYPYGWCVWEALPERNGKIEYARLKVRGRDTWTTRASAEKIAREWKATTMRDAWAERI